MSEFVNKVKKDNQEYNIQDARIPEVTAEDADKYLHVNAETGEIEFAEASGEEPTYIEIDVSHEDRDSSIAELVAAVESVPFNGYVEIKWTRFQYGTVFQNSSKGFLTLKSTGGTSYSMVLTNVEIRQIITEYGDVKMRPIYVEKASYTGEVETGLYQFLSTNRETIEVSPALKDDFLPKSYISLAGGRQHILVEKQSSSGTNVRDWVTLMYSMFSSENGDALLTDVIGNTTDSVGSKNPFLLDYEFRGTIRQLIITKCVVRDDYYGIAGIDLTNMKVAKSTFNVPFDKTVSEFISLFDSNSVSFDYPNLPSDASSKTYVLKAVNGTLTWVEE